MLLYVIAQVVNRYVTYGHVYRFKGTSEVIEINVKKVTVAHY